MTYWRTGTDPCSAPEGGGVARYHHGLAGRVWTEAVVLRVEINLFPVLGWPRRGRLPRAARPHTPSGMPLSWKKFLLDIASWYTELEE